VDQRHSGMGIASFVISLVMGVVLFLLIAAAGVAEVSIPGGLPEDSPWTVLLGLAILACLVVTLAGLGLGIAGLAQRNRARVLSVLGTVFNSAIILGTVLLIVIGTLIR
jgi:hypothetical protein